MLQMSFSNEHDYADCRRVSKSETMLFAQEKAAPINVDGVDLVTADTFNTGRGTNEIESRTGCSGAAFILQQACPWNHRMIFPRMKPRFYQMV